MAIDATANYESYGGNNSDTEPYAIPFRFDDPKWLRVERVDANGIVTPLTNGTDYHLSEGGELGTATLTTTQPLPGSSRIVLARYTPAEQDLTLLPNAPLPAKSLEATLDQIVMALQDRDANPTAQFSRALVFPLAEPEDNPTILDLPHLRKDTVLYFSPVDGSMKSLGMVQLAQKISALIGVLGPRGPVGYRGPTGYRGPEGYRGPYGYQGGAGPQGERGIIGPTGFQGMPGEDGKPGDPGDPGEPGDKGPDGDRGPVGFRGPTGYRGEDGDRGPTGYRGATGYQGPPGEPGEDGADGTCECTCGY